MVATDILGGRAAAPALLRWWVGLAVSKLYRGHFPLGTFLINERRINYRISQRAVRYRLGERCGEWLNAGLLTGVLGGYNHLQQHAVRCRQLAHAHQRLLAAGYLIVSVVTGVMAAACGAWLACP